jgi:hypothetical protein
VVFVFGGTKWVKGATQLPEIKQAYPHAHIFGCSTAGEICGTTVRDDTLTATAVHFEHTRLRGVQLRLSEVEHSSLAAGERLAKALREEAGLVHGVVFSEGLAVNGSELVAGFNRHLPPGVVVTGGLAGDGDRFAETFAFLDPTGPPESGTVAALGFYGSRLKVGYGFLGGWQPFGPERLITRAAANVLYELDGQPALELYKKYLGEHAADLPASGLRFPLNLLAQGGQSGLVRTILSVNEAEQSITFAGDMPQGAYARLMKANFEELVEGAVAAAETSYAAIAGATPDLALLISCVGRKLILQQRTEEELEGVREVLGEGTAITGFYSYGEICPAAPHASCELHNQTMTITTFTER